MIRIVLLSSLYFLLTIAPAGAIHISELNLDSMWTVWQDTDQPDTNRLNAIDEMVRVLGQTDPDSALSLAQLQYDYAREKNIIRYMADGLSNQANCLALKNDFQNAISIANKSLEISRENSYKKGIAVSNTILGFCLFIQGNLDEASDLFFSSLGIFEELGEQWKIAQINYFIGNVFFYRADYQKSKTYYYRSLSLLDEIAVSEKRKGIRYVYNISMAAVTVNLGNIYMYQGHYLKALDYFYRSLKAFEELKIKQKIALCISNIGTVYSYQKDYVKSLDYLDRGLQIFKEIGDKRLICNMLINLGSISIQNKDYEKSMEYFNDSYKLAEELGIKQFKAFSLLNLGELNYELGQYSEALDYIEMSLEISSEIGDKLGQTIGLTTKTQIYQKLGKYSQALELAIKSLKLAREIGALDESKLAAQILFEAYKAKGDDKKALEAYELYIQLRDSLENEENTKAVIQQEYKYEYEKKAVADSIKNAEAAKVKDAQLIAQEAQLNEEATLRISLMVGLGLVLLFSFFIFNRLRITRRQKKVIEEQKEIVEEQKKDITDSIQYAENIQKALLPSSQELSLIPDGFVLFQPKDIVSGDFYWMQHHSDKVYLAACDCTGHGVPGAFMSMIGSSLLDEAVVEKGLTQPNEIFFEVRKGFINALKQTGETQKDGMDAVLIAWDKQFTLQVAAAYSPVLIISNGKMKELKPDRQPVGFHTGEQKPFTHHEIMLEKGDAIYLFSDGYPDQFGGKKDKKFMMKNFKKLLLSIQDKTMNEQKNILENTMAEWKGEKEQVDDILVIGVQF